MSHIGPAENHSLQSIKTVQFRYAVGNRCCRFGIDKLSPEDTRTVVEMLAPLGVDLVELSGGSYEAPAMMGASRDERTLALEAYFLEFGRDIAAIATMPLMVTGGIRRRAVAEQVVDSGVAMRGSPPPSRSSPTC